MWTIHCHETHVTQDRRWNRYAKIRCRHTIWLSLQILRLIPKKEQKRLIFWECSTWDCQSPPWYGHSHLDLFGTTLNLDFFRFKIPSIIIPMMKLIKNGILRFINLLILGAASLQFILSESGKIILHIVLVLKNNSKKLNVSSSIANNY